MTPGPALTRLLDDEQVARRYAEGLWDQRTIADVVDGHATERPDHLAVIDARERVTFAELRDRSRRLAVVLAEFGVGEGTPVAAQLPGCVLLPALHLACVRLGALYLPLSTAWAASELRSLLAAVRAPVLVVGSADGHAGGVDLLGQAEEVRTALPDLRAVVPARTGTGQSIEARAAAASPADEELRQRHAHPDAPTLVMSSSGTTGTPKAAVWGGNDLKALLVHNVGPRLGITADDVAAGLAPAGTGSTGYVFPVLAPLLLGATAAVLERWSPQAALDLLVREGATYATAIPTQMTMLLPLELEAVDLSRLTRFNNAGAPLPPEVARTIEERMGCRVQSIYGSTDGGVPVMTSVTDPDDARRSTVGSPCRGVEMALVGADGGELAEREPGEVCWRGGKSWGYLGQPDNDRAAFDQDGYFHSGDVGVLDDHGRLRIVGRIKDMILRGGTNIFPAEIEQLLTGHPDVADVALVAVPDDRLGERACAVVVPRAGTTPRLDGLCTFLRECRIAVEKLPEQLVLTDELPTNAGGKVDKAALRSTVLAGRERRAAGIGTGTGTGEPAGPGDAAPSPPSPDPAGGAPP